MFKNNNDTNLNGSDFNFDKNEKINSSQLHLLELPGKFKRTVIKNNFDEELLKKLRKKLGCGGSLFKDGIGLQGDYITNKKLKKILEEQGLLVLN